MKTVPVTVVSCLYGDRGYERFVSEWSFAIRRLEPRPERAIVVTDRVYDIPAADVFVAPRCEWKHPQAFYLQRAIEIAMSEWVWIVDIDDRALPGALDGIDDVDADVWMMGYTTADVTYLPPPMTAAQVLNAHGNHIPAGSAIRHSAFRAAGGFPDAAFQDWGLWRRLAAAGATFESSGRAGYRYRRHADTRSAVELTSDMRAAHLAEMMESETSLVH